MKVLYGLALIAAAGCSSLPERSHQPWDDVVERTWTVTRIDRTPVIAGTRIVVTFGADGTVTGRAQNQFHAAYAVDGHALTIEPAAVTRMYFDDPPGAMDQEGRFIVLLQDIARWDGKLVLSTEDGREIEMEPAR